MNATRLIFTLFALAAGSALFATSYSPPIVFFEAGRAQLTSSERQRLIKETATWITGYKSDSRPICSISLSGHTGRFAPDEQSMELSFRRAQNVRATLKKERLLVGPTYIQAFGNLRPLVGPGERFPESVNDRVEVVITPCLNNDN